MTLIDKQYDIAKIKQKLTKEKESAKQWLKAGKRDSRLLDSFVVRISIGELEALINHVDALTSMLDDDFK